MSGNSSPTSIPGISLPNWFGGSGDGQTFSQAAKDTMANMNAAVAESKKDPMIKANTTAMQRQLASNSAAALYGTNLTTGAGLLDTPSTTSHILLGS